MATRRQVLKGAGMTAVAGMASGLAGATRAMDAKSVQRWDHETDIVCVGGGCAALTTAAVAAEAGREVVVLEKGPILGGTTARSGGVFWVPNHFLLREKGVEDKREDALRYMCRYAYPELYDADSPTFGIDPKAFRLLEAYYDNGSVMVDHVRSIGALDVRQFTDTFGEDGPVDYLSHVPENRTPRGRSLVPRLPDGSQGGGMDMIGQLETFLERHRVPMLTEHRVVRLITDEGAVVGVEAEHQGQQVFIRARRATFFGTGGYAHNPELVRAHQQPYHFGACASALATGDLIPMAEAVGAKLGNMASGWRTTVVFEQAVQNPVVALGSFMQPGDSSFVVNKYGVRVVNEKRNYNDRTRVHQVFDPTHGEYPNLLTFYVYDRRTAEAYAGNYPLPAGGRADHVIEGATLAELAANIGKRLERYRAHTGGLELAPDFADRLEETIERFNGFARSGRDADFGRGDQDYDRQWAPFFAPMRTDTEWAPNDLENETLYPLQDEGPYYCIILAPGFLDTSGGPVTNEKAQMLDGWGQPIPGLYGAGNCVASPSRSAYYGAGGTIGLAMTFAYIAAVNAMEEPVKDV